MLLLRAVAPAARATARLRWGSSLTLCPHAGGSYYGPPSGGTLGFVALWPFRPPSPHARACLGSSPRVAISPPSPLPGGTAHGLRPSFFRAPHGRVYEHALFQLHSPPPSAAIVHVRQFWEKLQNLNNIMSYGCQFLVKEKKQKKRGGLPPVSQPHLTTIYDSLYRRVKRTLYMVIT